MSYFDNNEDYIVYGKIGGNKNMATNGQLSTKVKTGEVRFSFCHLFEPHAFEETQEAKYSLMLLIDKNDKETVGAINTAYKNAKQNGINTYGQKFSQLVNDLLCKPGDKSGLVRDGDTDPRYSDSPETYAGKYILNCKCKTAPGVYAKERGTQKLTMVDQEIIYSGCFGIVTFNLYPYQKAGNTGIGVGLNNVLKTRDGDNLGGRVSGEVDFADEFNDTSAVPGFEADDDLLG